MTTPPSTLRADLERLAACFREMNRAAIGSDLSEEGALCDGLSHLASIVASNLPPIAPAPCAPFKIGDRVRHYGGGTGEIIEIDRETSCLVRSDNGHEDWCAEEALEPLAPTPEIAAGLTGDCASAMRLAAHFKRENKKQNDKIEKLRADLAAARAENERIAKERDHFACLHDMAMKKRDQFLAERDADRAELADVERLVWEWRDWVEEKLPMVEWHSDDHARRLLDQKLAAKSLPARESVEAAAEWIDSSKTFPIPNDADGDFVRNIAMAANALRKWAATLPSAPSPGPVFTTREVQLVRTVAAGYLDATLPALRIVADKMAQLKTSD